jgi:hypothetical protein
MAETTRCDNRGVSQLSARTIFLKEIPANEAQILTQVLHAALGSTRALPVMFPLNDCGSGEPTPSEAAHSEEVLQYILNNSEILPHHALLVANSLLFMIDTFDNLMEYGSDTYDGREIPGDEYIRRVFGIDYTDAFRDVALKYVRRLVECRTGFMDNKQRIQTYLRDALNDIMGRIMFEQKITSGDITFEQKVACELYLSAIADICCNILDQQK